VFFSHASRILIFHVLINMKNLSKQPRQQNNAFFARIAPCLAIVAGLGEPVAVVLF
jgi:hypothetical protein